MGLAPAQNLSFHGGQSLPVGGSQGDDVGLANSHLVSPSMAMRVTATLFPSFTVHLFLLEPS